MLIKRFSWLFLLIILSLMACSRRDVPIGERFRLEKDEYVQLVGYDLTIQLESVGREWDDQGEYVYVNLIVQLGREERKISVYMDDPWQLSDYQIQLVSANPFGDPTSCELLVTKAEEK